MKSGIIIIGAGHAGVQAAVSLRQENYEGPIRLIDQGTELPYQRPPLSKAYLAGEKSADQLIFKSQEFFEDNNIELILEKSVTAINASSKLIEIGEERYSYDTLIIATGAAPRQLDEYHHNNVMTLRDMPEARALQDHLKPGNRIALIGGGFIGLEVAATAKKLGLDVDVIEAQDRLLKRAMPEAISNFIAKQHTLEGVNIHLQTQISSIEEKDGNIKTLILSNGKEIHIDLALLCIGSSPRIKLARDIGLEIDSDGIRVNDVMQTSHENIYAIGDCTTFQTKSIRTPTRLESVQNALDQAKILASHLTGQKVHYEPTPWFWSDQFDLKFQMVGLSETGTEITMRGDPESKKFTLLETRGEKLIATYCVNRPADHMASRRIISGHHDIDIKAAMDPDTPLKTCQIGD